MEVVTVQANQGTAGRMPAGGVRRRKSRDSGQSLLEFVFLLPILLLLAIGIVELGRAAAFTIAVNNAATAGVEYGSQNEAKAQDLVGMQTAAINDINAGSFTFGTVNAAAANGCLCDPGTGISCSYPVTGMMACGAISCAPDNIIVECVQVTTHGTWNALLHYPGLPASYQANGEAVMRVRR